MLNSGQLGNGLVSHPKHRVCAHFSRRTVNTGDLKTPSKRAERLSSRLTGHFSTQNNLDIKKMSLWNSYWMELVKPDWSCL